jgi:hypothetical protein
LRGADEKSMPPPKVYIESTIPSFYCETRTDPEAVARRNWTQHWWDFKRDSYVVYVSPAVLDELNAGDALHLALASYHECDFLLTWNCQHLANANKFQHIRLVNGMLGLHVPSLVTPLELLAEES